LEQGNGGCKGQTKEGKFHGLIKGKHPEPDYSKSKSKMAPGAAATAAWNSAGTWEEKDTTKWASDKLTEILSNTRYEFPGGCIFATRIKPIAGDSSIAFIRGRKRWMFDFSNIEIEFKAILDRGGSGVGKCKLPDVASDCMGEYEMEVFWKSEGNSSSVKSILSKHLSSGTGFQSEIVNQISLFVSEFQRL
jgi:activator of HSP90 ATPase